MQTTGKYIKRDAIGVFEIKAPMQEENAQIIDLSQFLFRLFTALDVGLWLGAGNCEFQTVKKRQPSNYNFKIYILVI